MNPTYTKTIVICIFSIAMAALESAVVVYLRALYYPEGFTVAMKMIDEKILLVEIVREAATIIMLWAIAFLTGKNFKERFAYFLISFAVWDIFYYVWLKIFIDWPSSLFDWDILFLIPITWLGPVIVPVICSITMITLAFVLLKTEKRANLSITVWGLLATGSLFILFTFIQDYANIVLSNGFATGYTSIMNNPDFFKITSAYLPQSYNWGVFSLGEAFIISGTIKILIIRE